MNDWISKAADERNKKLVAKLAAEQRQKHEQEEIETIQERWHQLNQVKIEETFRCIEKHSTRAKDAGFGVGCKYTSTAHLLIHNEKRMFEDSRQIEFKLNYKDGLVLEFYKSWQNGRYRPERKKNRDYSFNTITEDKILSWIKWVATGNRPFWLI